MSTYTVKTISMAPYVIACSMQHALTVSTYPASCKTYLFCIPVFGGKVFLIFPIIYLQVGLRSVLDDTITHFLVLNYRQVVWLGYGGCSFVCRYVRISGLLIAPLVLRIGHRLCILPAITLVVDSRVEFSHLITLYTVLCKSHKHQYRQC